MVRYVSRYNCHDTIHDTIRYITTKQEGYCYGMVYFYNKHDIETEHDEISFIIHKSELKANK